MKKLTAGMVAAMFVGAMGLVMVNEANAGTRTPRANKRMRNQTGRINQGVRSGELTKDEAKGLRQDHKEIRKEIRDAKSDGKVTREERKEIRKDLNTESKKIYDEKHDGDKRPKAQGNSTGDAAGGTTSSTGSATGDAAGK